MYHARWLSKAIYSLKIFLFCHQLKLNASDRKAFADICIFIVKIYVRAWYLMPQTIETPIIDFQFMKALKAHKEVDPLLSNATLRKFMNHLWYLMPESITFSFFNEVLPLDLKEKTCNSFLNHSAVNKETEKEDNETDKEFNEDSEEKTPIDFKWSFKKLKIERAQVNELLEGDLDQFITPETRNFFSCFNIDQRFLEKKPTEWSDDVNY